MTLVYSDGFETAVVGWSDGVLGDGVTHATDLSAGLPSVAAWQAGGAVVTVASNCSAEMMSAITAMLPDEAAYSPSLLDRAAAGLGRIVGQG